DRRRAGGPVVRRGRPTGPPGVGRRGAPDSAGAGPRPALGARPPALFPDVGGLSFPPPLRGRVRDNALQLRRGVQWVGDLRPNPSVSQAAQAPLTEGHWG